MLAESHLEQVLPSNSDLFWPIHSQTLRAALGQLENDPTWYCQSFNPYPLALDRSQLNFQQCLQGALAATIEAVVKNYFHDSGLRQLLTLSEPVEKLLEQIDSYENSEYSIGSYRPDFLHDQNQAIQICEINARFPANGYFISAYLQQVAPSMPYLEGLNRTVDACSSLLSAFMSRFTRPSNIYILREREKGWDIHFLEFELKKYGHIVQTINIDELLHLPVELISSDNTGVILELHQSEITQESVLSKLRILAAKVPQRFWLNDLRTIFLVHDKRFLGLFQHPELLLKYIKSEQITLLGDHIVPTFVLSQNPKKFEEALAYPEKFLLKPNLLGKGEGIIFGKDLSTEKWQALLRSAPGDYVLQNFIEQEKFRFSGAENSSPVNLIGTLLCLDKKFFGPGIYRASPGDIVNVAGGGSILFPLIRGEQ